MVAPSSSPPVLAGRSIVKRFPGVVALDRVDFEVRAGEVHGLIGENGAGKTTLMHILAGAQQPSEGQILLDGQPIRFASTCDALQHRISIVYQELNLIPYLTVAENIFLGREIVSSFGWIDANSQNLRCSELLKPLDPTIDPRAPLNSLRVGQQQIVEIAKALNSKARVLFMDEPTSAISDSEVEVLFRLIRSLSREGIAVVYVSHKMDELLRITDRITVLRDGRFVETVQTDQTTQEAIVRLMVGRDLSQMYAKHSATKSSEVLRVESLSQHSPARKGLIVDRVSFAVAAGEVLGIFGLMGAGRTELLESIFGMHPTTTYGSVYLHGTRRDIRSPAQAMSCGIGLVPEDRKQQGLVLDLSVQNNISLSNIGLIERFGLLHRRLEEQHAQSYVTSFRSRHPPYDKLRSR